MAPSLGGCDPSRPLQGLHEVVIPSPGMPSVVLIPHAHTGKYPLHLLIPMNAHPRYGEEGPATFPAKSKWQRISELHTA